ncbi:MAG: type III polyketide synthase, partial [Trueperaceae bacterium]|nr:type III polyketide synthase [Trueperaceae bacterium]
PVVPAPSVAQGSAQAAMERIVGGDRRTDKLLRRIYPASGIETRHSVLEDFVPEGSPPSKAGHDADGTRWLPPAQSGPGFFVTDAGDVRSPGTKERNDRYRSEAGPLFVTAARDALEATPDVGPDDVTHVVTVSCTGFYAPGPDLDVVHGLGLRGGTERYHLGFMGCYAAFPALRMARAFVEADPDAVVLIAWAELCTLHLQHDRDPDALVSASVFADGAVGAVVSGRPPSGPALRLDAFADGLAPEGASDMAWTVGDTGFEMTLSAYVPKIVGAKAHAALGPLLAGRDLDLADVPRWAVHPGGRAILDKLADGLELPDAALAASRGVLARYGNMSSATVMFVLAALLREPGPPGEPVIAMAFGPGLTVASGLLTFA